MRKEYVNLTLLANGKAELYFHAYVWQQYCIQLAQEHPYILLSPQVKRLSCLSINPERIL